ncbi:hypothetical protein WJ63_00930 [Burkholderia pyrrocinia]|nr:hypothetical protein WJ63_00930 [Burkholderia pyrrocinia]
MTKGFIMPEYKLTLHVDQVDLETMHMAGQKIVIRKSTGAGGANVAWLAFKPMASNTVTWKTDYGLYASTTQIRSGAVIDRMSQLPTRSNPFGYPTDGQLYKLSDAGVFEGKQGEIEKGAYGFINNFSTEKYLTCGLLLAANVNGKVVMEPQSAVLVPVGNKMITKPVEKLEVFVAASIDSGSVCTEVVADKFEATYSGSVTKISCEYSGSQAKFIPVDELERAGVENYLFRAALYFGSTGMLLWSFNNFDSIAAAAKDAAGVVIKQFRDLDTAHKTFMILAASSTACAAGAKAVEKVIKELYPEKTTVDQVGGEADWVEAEVKTCQIER